MSDKNKSQEKGPIAWMTKNAVAANLLMFVLIIGGALVGGQVKQEVFPEFELDIISIGVPYPGASPSEVEQGIVLAIEESVRGLDGVKKITASAAESAAGVSVELLLGTDPNKALADIKNAVDRITSFPDEAERPVVSLISNRREVISVVIYGQQSEEVLRQLAERVREELLLHKDITSVELQGTRPREIAVEVPQANLRKYGLKLSDVAQRVARTSVELPGGGVKTDSGEVLLRVAQRRDLGAEFEEVVMLSTNDGTEVRLSDIADVKDGFQDVDLFSTFEDEPAVMVSVYRVGEQTPIEVAAAVKLIVEDMGDVLPPGVKVTTLDDRSKMYRERIDLLMRNAGLGLILVLVILGLFLEIRLAFWVTMGIPISFMGSLLLMPSMDVSINMISLFAFIITLGIVVDDAIVVGENIYAEQQQGGSALDAAVQGAMKISVPVVFSVLTTVAAFTPLFFVPGVSGKLFRVIPAIVVCVLAISLIESLFVLPAHLGHSVGADSERKESALMRVLQAPQRWFSSRLEHFILYRYGAVLRAAVTQRYFSIAVGIAMLVATIGYVASGRIEFTFMPKVDSDVVTAAAVLPFGVPVEETERVRARILGAADALIKEVGEDKVLGRYTMVGSTLAGGGGPFAGAVTAGSHLGNVRIYLVSSDKRTFSAGEFAKMWRKKVGEVPGLETLSFKYSTGPGGGPGIEVQLSHRSMEVLERAAADLAGNLETYAGVTDIDDGFSAGKPQLDFKLKPEARSLGLTAIDIGRQVRNAFFGAEALRQQRGRDEVRVMVRLPESERSTEFSVEEMLVRTPRGGEVPLSVAADVQRGTSYTVIKRTDGRRIVNVTGDIEPGKGNAGKVLASLRGDFMPSLKSSYPGLAYSFEGDNRRQAESLDSLKTGYLFAMFLIFALLAVPFKSYIQPSVVMSAIPFGIVGAVGGHVIMGYDLSIISIMGIVAVSGIVVNDSLVLVHAANAERERGVEVFEAIQSAARRRFRPILLTSLTTFFGLAPMILETSVQARFLIPMAISLGFGVLFATGIILLIVPSCYLVVEDLKRFFGIDQPEDEPAPAPMTVDVGGGLRNPHRIE